MLFLVALLLLTFPSTFAKCPTGTFQGMIPDLCYLTSYTRMTWLHAEYYCNQQGGHLASVQDPYTNKYIAQQLGGYPSVWLGGTTIPTPIFKFTMLEHQSLYLQLDCSNMF
uniref:C-type lectin domain-containing protein n=1 Tax=Acrobeloides nanus TaxID=290746 RepID=A0A914D3A9_9BILA